MFNRLVNQQLGVPIGTSNFKFVFGVDDAIIAGAGINAGSSIIGNIFGAFNQSSANKTNLAIARERNALTEKLFNQNIANQWKMWNANNEYNSASAQRARLEAAGYNPWMLLNGSSAGTAQAVSQGSTPDLATAQVQAYKPDMTGFQQAGTMLYNAASYRANINATIASTQQTMANIEQIKANVDKTFSEIKGQDLLNTQHALNNNIIKIQESILRDTMQDVKDQMAIKTVTDSYNATIAKLNTGIQELMLKQEGIRTKYLDRTLSMQIASMAAGIAANYASVDLSHSQSAYYGALKLKTEMETEGVRISNGQAQKIFSFVLDKMKSESKMYDSIRKYNDVQSKWLPINSIWQNTNGSVNALGNLIPGIGQIGKMLKGSQPVGPNANGYVPSYTGPQTQGYLH